MAKLSGWSYISQLGLMKPLDINKHGNFVHIYNILSLSLSLALFLSATYPSSQHAKLQNVESQKLSSPQLVLTFFIFPSSLLLQLLGENFFGSVMLARVEGGNLCVVKVTSSHICSSFCCVFIGHADRDHDSHLRKEG